MWVIIFPMLESCLHLSQKNGEQSKMYDESVLFAAALSLRILYRVKRMFSFETSSSYQSKTSFLMHEAQSIRALGNAGQ
jgi:hypothetical protein